MRDGATITLARHLRRSETTAEKRLWQELRNRKLDGCKFVRQAAVGPYIADFLCREARLIIEIDGATHSAEADIRSDKQRTGRLGYKVIRLQNIEVLDAMDHALMVIREALSHIPSPAPRIAERPLPQAGEDVDGAYP